MYREDATENVRPKVWRSPKTSDLPSIAGNAVQIFQFLACILLVPATRRLQSFSVVKGAEEHESTQVDAQMQDCWHTAHQETDFSQT